MRGSYCYMPILPARYGAFRAVASLSPIGRSRIAPMFDVPNVVLKTNQTIDSYLEKRARETRNCWEPDRVSCLDVHNLPLDALRVVAGVAVFRNLSIAASSVPDLLPKKDQGKVRRERRRDFDLWDAILELRQDGHPRLPLPHPTRARAAVPLQAGAHHRGRNRGLSPVCRINSNTDSCRFAARAAASAIVK